MLKRFLILVFALIISGFAGKAFSDIYPPRPGVKYPEAYLERIKKDKTAFRFQKAWFEKTRRARESRELLLSVSRDGAQLSQFMASRPLETAVAGTSEVPVFMVKFSNSGTDPFPSSDLQQELFDGPWPTGTMSDYYSEISYGAFSLGGTVYSWFQLSDVDTVYEGSDNGLGADSKVGQLILETLNNWDASVDFSQYDNDGPDGLPNSGDDDGFVDFVSFVHPEIGGECGTTNIWSHRWVVTGWPEFSSPYTTNDARTGGGFIRVYDYTIQPALSCTGSMIEIGVYCHEFGHAFGLPDYYDTNGGSAGIGHWGVMGSGSWNEPDSPAHMTAWSKMQLGWVVPIDIGPSPTPITLDNVEFNPQVYKLNVMEEKWRRLTGCTIAGSYSMHCGLTASEASARNWPGGEGYGNGWNESVLKDFTYNGSNPVNLSFDYAYSMEPGYDYTYLSIIVNGSEYTLRTYNGVNSGSELVDITPYLSGSGASSYQIKLRFTSDSAWSDEDGDYTSTCGAFTFDNVVLTGGGENYSGDFETYEDGWHVDMTDPAEFFLLENRQPLGFDQHVHGGGGLIIWHVDTAVGNNTGGADDLSPHLLSVEEADGLDNLLNNDNRGDGGDPFPGSSSNTLFDYSSTPSSYSNNGNVTNASVSLISSSGDPMSATASGGWFVPTLTSIDPDSGFVTGGTMAIDDIIGTGFNYGASFYLTNGSGPDITASSEEWTGHAKLSGTIDLTGAVPGYYDLVVENPDGQTAVLSNAFQIIDTTTTDSGTPDAPRNFALKQNYPNPFNPTTTISFDIAEQHPVSLKIYDAAGRIVRTLVNEVLSPRQYRVVWNGKNDSGANVSSGVYFYRLRAGDRFSEVRKLVLLR